MRSAARDGNKTIQICTPATEEVVDGLLDAEGAATEEADSGVKGTMGDEGTDGDEVVDNEDDGVASTTRTRVTAQTWSMRAARRKTAPTSPACIKPTAACARCPGVKVL
jgi:hypothetical protein